MHVVARIAVVGLLFVTVVGMGAYYESVEDRHWPYPSTDHLVTSYGDHVGDQTFLFGTVERVDREDRRARIVADSDHGEFAMTVDRFGADVEPGGIVQVYGTLEPDRRMTADEVVVVNPGARSNHYKYAVSLLGALLVVVAFFRHWRIDPDALTLQPRNDG